MRIEYLSIEVTDTLNSKTEVGGKGYKVSVLSPEKYSKSQIIEIQLGKEAESRYVPSASEESKNE